MIGHPPARLTGPGGLGIFPDVIKSTRIMDTYRMPIAQRIDWLMDHARRHSEAFRSPEAWLARSRYLAEHPAAISVLKSMDGRINIPVATNTPTGISQPFSQGFHFINRCVEPSIRPCHAFWPL
jgi:hypothetical protein